MTDEPTRTELRSGQVIRPLYQQTLITSSDQNKDTKDGRLFAEIGQYREPLELSEHSANYTYSFRKSAGPTNRSVLQMVEFEAKGQTDTDEIAGRSTGTVSKVKPL